MSKQDLGPLGVVDLLTGSELKEAMGHNVSHQIREWYRGVDYMGAAGPGNGTGLITINPIDQGYTWSVRLVSVQLSAAGTLSVYPGDTNTVAPVGSQVAIANGGLFEVVYQWSSSTLVLKDGRNVTLYCGAANILNWRIMAKQVPTEMQGKLLGS